MGRQENTRLPALEGAAGLRGGVPRVVIWLRPNLGLSWAATLQKEAIEGGLDTEPPLSYPASRNGRFQALNGRFSISIVRTPSGRTDNSLTAGPPITGARSARHASSSALLAKGATPAQMRFFL